MGGVSVTLLRLLGLDEDRLRYFYIPLYADRGGVNRLRRKGGAKNAEFPPQFIREQGLKNQEHK
jgi:hypothetical protein